MTTPSPLTPAGLRCAHLVNPLGVAPDRVRFSWLLEGTGIDCRRAVFKSEFSRTRRGACPRKRLSGTAGGSRQGRLRTSRTTGSR